MPSIDRERLERQARAAFAELPDAGAVSRALLELYTFYSARARRRPMEASVGERGREFGAPPIVAAVVRTSLKRMEAPPQVWQSLAAELWRTGYRELREAAGVVLAGQEPEEAHRVLPGFLRQEIAGDDLLILVENVLEPLRRRSPEQYWRWLEACIEGDERYQRRLALAALRVAVSEQDFVIRPRLFEILRGVGSESHGWERVAFDQLIRQLSNRHSLEVVRFLEQEIRQNPLDTRLTALLKSLMSEGSTDWR